MQREARPFLAAGPVGVLQGAQVDEGAAAVMPTGVYSRRVRTKGACSVAGCDRPERETGLCGMHYARKLRYGDVFADFPCRRRRNGPTPLELFMAKVEPEPMSGCWLWTGGNNGNGYGRFYVEGKWAYPHRFAYELLVGPIPHGLVIDHLCRNPACCNPLHLEAVTPQVNVLRGTSPMVIAHLTNRCVSGRHDLVGQNIVWHGKGRGCRACENEAQVRRYHEKRAAS